MTALDARTDRASRGERGQRVVEKTRTDHLRSRRRHRAFLILSRSAVVVTAVILWQLASGTIVRPFFVSSPPDVWSQLWEWWGSADFWYHVRFTINAALFGFLGGSLSAILLAWPFGMMRLAYRVVEPYFLIGYSIPAVALGPVFILWFGIGMTAKIVLAAYFVFFVVFINTVAGFRETPQGLLDVSRVIGASRWTTLKSVVFPSAIPYVLAALRITLPAAMIGAVVGEFIASNRGLGYLTRVAGASYDTAGVMAGVIMLGAIVLVMSLALRPLERALRWQPQVDLKGGRGGG
jgi:NitT/TauT family transport system permease protein